MRRFFLSALIGPLLVLGACAAPGGGGDGPTLEQANARFTFTPNTAMNVYFGCILTNSQLFYQLQLREDSTFTIGAQLDTGDVAFATGTYAYENDAIRLRTNPNNFIFLDEQTTSIVPQLGLVYSFETQVMRCVANGHEEDDPAGRIQHFYRCPEFSEGPASTQMNAVEFDISLPGAIFRDRNRWVRGNDQPIILRGTGIYRRVGSEFVGYFGNQFDDHNVVTGTFLNSNAAVQIDQLPAAFSECERR